MLYQPCNRNEASSEVVSPLSGNIIRRICQRFCLHERHQECLAGKRSCQTSCQDCNFFSVGESHRGDETLDQNESGGLELLAVSVRVEMGTGMGWA